jgi:hypothetical protein
MMGCFYTEIKGGNMKEFHNNLMDNAHDAFQAWREQHPHGFFINWKSPNNMMLHRVECQHYGTTDWEINKARGWGNLGETKKICDTDKAALEHHARKHGTSELRYCRDCAP